MEIYHYASDILTQAQLTATLRKVRKYAKLGFYVRAEDISKQHATSGRWLVNLYGPKIYWKRKSVWELGCKQK